jgi:hypothetical protein
MTVGNSCEIPNEKLPTTTLQLSCLYGDRVILYLVKWQLVDYINGEEEQWFKLPDALLDFTNACQMG